MIANFVGSYHKWFFFYKTITFKCCYQSFEWSALSVILCLWDAGWHPLPEAVVPFVFTSTMSWAHLQPFVWMGERRGEADGVRGLSHKTCAIYSIRLILFPLTHASFLHLSYFHIPPSPAPLPLSHSSLFSSLLSSSWCWALGCKRSSRCVPRNSHRRWRTRCVKSNGLRALEVPKKNCQCTQ